MLKEGRKKEKKETDKQQENKRYKVKLKVH